MQDKYVRRRRTVLAILVVVVLIVVTAVFGAAENSPIHPVQQGLAKVFNPIGKGVSEVVSPVRGLGHWVSTTLHAKSRNATLRRDNQKLNRELAETGIAAGENAELRGMLALTRRLRLGRDAPVYADVTSYDPAVYYEQIGIDEGSGDGIKVGDPVVGQYGLVGTVTRVSANTATVSGMNSPKFGVYAQVIDPSGHGGYGTVEPVVSDLRALQINYLPQGALINNGDPVVTATYSQKGNRIITSPYPAGIPIGVVSGYSYGELETDGTEKITQSVNMRNLSDVEVLTDVKPS